MGLVNRKQAKPAVAAHILPTDTLWHQSLASDRPDLHYTNTSLSQLASLAVRTGAALSSTKSTMGPTAEHFAWYPASCMVQCSGCITPTREGEQIALLEVHIHWLLHALHHGPKALD